MDGQGLNERSGGGLHSGWTRPIGGHKMYTTLFNIISTDDVFVNDNFNTCSPWLS